MGLITRLQLVLLALFVLSCMDQAAYAVRVFNLNLPREALEKNRDPVSRACINGNIDQLQQLVDGGASVNRKDRYGVKPIAYAFICARFDVARWLVDHGAPVNSSDSGETSPLYWAVLSDDKSIVEFLLRKGADVDAGEDVTECGEQGNVVVKAAETPLSLARWHSDQAMVDLLLKYSKKPHANSEEPQDFSAKKPVQPLPSDLQQHTPIMEFLNYLMAVPSARWLVALLLGSLVMWLFRKTAW